MHTPVQHVKTKVITPSAAIDFTEYGHTLVQTLFEKMQRSEEMCERLLRRTHRSVVTVVVTLTMYIHSMYNYNYSCR